MGLELSGVKLVAQDAERYISQLTNAQKATAGMHDAGIKGAEGLSRFNAAGIPVVATLGDIVGIGKSVLGFFAGIGREALNATASHESLAMSMSSLVAKEIRAGDATLSVSDAMAQAAPRAQELLGWIEQLAIKSPFDSEGVALAFKTALTYGFVTDEAQRLTQALVNFATATGQSSAIVQQLAYPLGQIRTSGVALRQDLKQLTSAGVDVTAILKGMGKTWEDVSAGTVESNAFLKAFVETIENDFGNAAEASANTINGLLNSLSDLKTIGLRELFGPAIQATLPALSAMVTKFQEFIPVITVIGQKIGEFITFLVENRAEITRIVTSVGIFVGSLYLVANASAVATAAITALGVVSGIATGALGVLAGVIAFLLSPIGLVTAAVAGLAALFVVSFDEIQKQTQQTAAIAENRFGEMSDKMTQSSAQGTQQVADDWGDMGDKIAQTATQKTEESHSWGYNLIIQFANGMADAIGAVLDVLTQLGAAIASWLSPGSPPALLPDIDVWGESAMNEFLRGFTMANFDVFNQLGSTIEGFLRNIAPKDDVGLVPRILASREAIAGLVDELKTTGQVAESSFQNLFDQLGFTNPAIEQYIRDMVAVQAADERVRQAKENLVNITKKYSDQLDPLRAQLEGITEEQERTARADRRKELEEIIRRANMAGNAEAARRAELELQALAIQDQIDVIEDQQQAEEEAAQTAIDAAEAEQQAAADQLSASQALVQAQMENNTLLREQAELLERLNEAMAGGGGAGGAAGGAGGPLSGLGDAIAGAGDAVDDALDELTEDINQFLEDVTAPFAGLQEKFETLKRTWAAAFIVMGQAATAFYNEHIAPFADPLIQWLQEKIPIAVTEAQTSFGLLKEWLGENIPTMIETVSTNFSKFFGFDGLLVQWLNTTSTNITTWVQGTSDSFTGWIGKTSQGISEWFQKTKDGFMKWYTDTDTTLNTWNEESNKKILDFKDRAIQYIEEAWESIKLKFTNAKIVLLGTVNELIQGIKDFFFNTDWAALGADIISGLVQGIADNAASVIEALSGLMSDAWDAVSGFWDTGSDSRRMMKLGDDVVGGFITSLNQSQEAITGAFASAFSMSDPIAIPATTPPPVSNTTYNQQQYNMQGIGQVTAGNGVDVATIQYIVEETMSRVLSHGLS